jgi:hypothetical protein
MTTAERAAEASLAGRSRLRRCLEAIAVVAVVIAIGLVFDMGASAYVAMSFPATLIFQLGIRRRALHEMWVRDGPTLSRTTIIPWLAVLLAIPPLIALTSSDSAGDIIWSLVVIGGAVPASYVIAQRAPGTVRFIFLCLATGGVVGTLILLISVIGEVDDLAKKKVDFLDVAGSDTLALVETFLVLWPGYYMVEEVLFRGSIDSHVHHPGKRHGLWSAIFVSLLWGFGTFKLLSAKVRSRR